MTDFRCSLILRIRFHIWFHFKSLCARVFRQLLNSLCCCISPFFCLYVCRTSSVSESTGGVYTTTLILCFMFSFSSLRALLPSSGRYDMIDLIVYSSNMLPSSSSNYLLVNYLSPMRVATSEWTEKQFWYWLLLKVPEKGNNVATLINCFWNRKHFGCIN